jgi:hypothetical protein
MMTLRYLCAAALGLAACHNAPGEPLPPGSKARGSQDFSTPSGIRRGPSTALRQRIAADGSDGALRLRPRGFEQVAEGPSAIGVSPTGAVLVLDRLAGRVVTLTPQGELSKLADVPVDAEELAVSADGSFAAFSPLRATAWVFGRDGKSAGELTVPRELRVLQHLEMDASRMLVGRSAYQESFLLGSPSAPLPTAVVLASKREGAVLLSDDRGVALHVRDERAELWTLGRSEGGRSVTEARHAIDGRVSSGRVVGVDGNVVCLRLENVASDAGSSGPGKERLSVARRALCLDVATGQVTLDVALPAVGSYLPRRELALGGGYLALLQPEDDAVTVHRWRIDERGVGTVVQGVAP